ncbi:uncharacterized protein LY89DRAFT_673138 [Mollisia scopiformis]|uniref:Uncharacterized protein n=1 Tax=Mollisia scopiformis TaxID=149040 RepID=A0A194WZA3_MOLSC|nr:uncharacterized protein LY89DRAFT_673138 [Mollisia scopiformis]KUJ13039.1 hypothetical protein LY89DRAFT_673138 [Mollisia scopiformis]
MSSVKVIWSQIPKDERRKKLANAHIEKKNKLDEAEADKGDLDIERQRGGMVNENRVADLERAIIVYGNEAFLLDLTLKIYDLTCKTTKTPDDKQRLTDFWRELDNRASKPQKLKDDLNLDKLWEQLKLDSGYTG